MMKIQQNPFFDTFFCSSNRIQLKTKKQIDNLARGY
jgi:hypothetical protein